MTDGSAAGEVTSRAGPRGTIYRVLVMGVSGCGKTTVGRLLATRLDWPFLDADDLHPPANVAKMAAGIPLTDADRAPWLAMVAAWIAERRAAGESGVVACSALKRAYRDTLRAADPRTSAGVSRGRARVARRAPRPTVTVTSSRNDCWRPNSRTSRSPRRTRIRSLSPLDSSPTRSSTRLWRSSPDRHTSGRGR